MPAPQRVDFKLIIPILADGALVVVSVGQPGVSFDPVKRGSGHLPGDQGGFGFVLPKGTAIEVWKDKKRKNNSKENLPFGHVIVQGDTLEQVEGVTLNSLLFSVF